MNRRLVRSRTDTIVGGVAAGLASYLNTDPALVRIAWAILVPVTGGAALIAYIVAWIVVPEAPEGGPPPAAAPATDPVTGAPVEPVADSSSWTPPEPVARPSDGRAGVVVGVGLVLIGVWFLLREYLPDFDWSLVWPLVIVGIGVLILVSSIRRRER
ncbi:MAG: PspC domain-containing protein [Candidatus Limnocylindria bacterium]